MEGYEIKDLSVFDEQEHYHIRTLGTMIRQLRGDENSNGLGKAKKDQLIALEWVMTVLSEISEE